jgi:hypothetical protein
MSERPYENLMNLVNKNYYTLTVLERLVRDTTSKHGAYLSFKDADDAAAELTRLRAIEAAAVVIVSDMYRMMELIGGTMDERAHADALAAALQKGE